MLSVFHSRTTALGLGLCVLLLVSEKTSAAQGVSAVDGSQSKVVLTKLVQPIYPPVARAATHNRRCRFSAHRPTEWRLRRVRVDFFGGGRGRHAQGEPQPPHGYSSRQERRARATSGPSTSIPSDGSGGLMDLS